MMDPEILDLNFQRAFELCRFEKSGILNFFDELVRRADKQMHLKERPECTGPSELLNRRCWGAAEDNVRLKMLDFLEDPMHALHYSSKRSPLGPDEQISMAGPDSATAPAPPCPVHVEWLVVTRPLQIHPRQLERTQAMLEELRKVEPRGSGPFFKESFRDIEDNGWVDLVTLLRSNSMSGSHIQRHVSRNIGSMVASVLIAAGLFVVLMRLLAFPGEYEPDLQVRTRQARWSLVVEHGVTCICGVAAAPVFCSQLRLHEDDWHLPWVCHMHLNLLILFHLAVELWYVRDAGSARRRLFLPEAACFLMFDALAVADLYTDVLFFCVAYIAGSSLCWITMAVFLLGRVVGQWLLGAVLAARTVDEPLVHWYPRHMGLMHAVVLRQLLDMQRWDQVTGGSTWLMLPLVKCVFEDLPQVAVQLAFNSVHNSAHLLIQVSIVVSAVMALSSLFFSIEQAYAVRTGFGNGFGTLDVKDSAPESPDLPLAGARHLASSAWSPGVSGASTPATRSARPAAWRTAGMKSNASVLPSEEAQAAMSQGTSGSGWC
eukprot:gnl/TRDRNA2_/TRDRNA2_170170_c2_seq1.p1 gnl/TRDRNA2_/TRDRNA2_170170_c2~~gnl/TRDRNA2_/TRDRNA2_170170_c2_seq1.p1  ORF type:complete len:612 (+),score=106.47 gnl/TRDRNA2_/TRDRNA2_170170_c2_seq1:204-1838(+)